MKKRLHFSALDLTRTRFAFSPLFETVIGFVAMHQPSRYAIHLPWIREALEATAPLELDILQMVLHPNKNSDIPDFLTPPPTTPLPNFSDELHTLLHTDPALVRRELEHTWRNQGQLSPAQQNLLDNPQTTLERICAALQLFWEHTLEMHWPKIRATLEADVLTRARNQALGGAEAMFDKISPMVQYQNGVLELDQSMCSTLSAEIDLAGRGLLLMPSAFVWPTFMTILDPPWQPVLAYTPRGIANLWSNQAPPNHPALELLLGQGRSEVLLSLETPSSTLELSKRLHLASSGVSEHLSLLRQTGLVESQRRGRSVYYQLSCTGIELLRLFHAETSPVYTLV